MAAQKYIFKDEQQLGPFEDDYIVFSLQNGKFSFEDLCWEEGWEAWRQLNSVFQPPPPPNIVKPPPAPSLQRKTISSIESPRDTIPKEDDSFKSLLSTKIKDSNKTSGTPVRAEIFFIYAPNLGRITVFILSVFALAATGV